MKLTGDHVLSFTLNLWLINKYIHMQDKFHQLELNLDRPFLVNLSSDIDGVMLRDGNNYFTLANMNNEKDSFDLPARDDTPFEPIRVGNEVEPNGERCVVHRDQCIDLYPLFKSSARLMLTRNLISEDTYFSWIGGLDSAKLMRFEHA